MAWSQFASSAVRPTSPLHDVVVEGQGFSDLDVVSSPSGSASLADLPNVSHRAGAYRYGRLLDSPARALENSRYKRKLVLIDADGNGSAAPISCSKTPLRRWPYATDFVVKVTPTSISKVGPGVLEAECEWFRNWPLE